MFPLSLEMRKTLMETPGIESQHFKYGFLRSFFRPVEIEVNCKSLMEKFFVTGHTIFRSHDIKI